MLTVDKVIRTLRKQMGPHVRHQAKWELRDGGAIWCRQCDRRIVDFVAFQKLGPLLSPDAQAQVRDSITEWLAQTAEKDARIFPIHRPDARLVTAKRIAT